MIGLTMSSGLDRVEPFGSGGETLATLLAAVLDRGSTRTRPHPIPEAMTPLAPANLWLISPLHNTQYRGRGRVLNRLRPTHAKSNLMAVFMATDFECRPPGSQVAQVGGLPPRLLDHRWFGSLKQTPVGRYLTTSLASLVTAVTEFTTAETPAQHQTIFGRPASV